ncbi:hypothetical protein [Fluviispira multicolorata]|uniref:Uncharacterized protein n=1 Tax=Fluviispira multicolorata TaxID=2654512 RepID=A0A833JFP7_9BACT|nr:hypothetical protein [Fluviispira multicolorata]KAB8031767.1 hypothetical protein GCL57_03765 [Fluviispira multicolorata]
MVKQSANSIKIDVSYELYRELAGEICAPIDDTDLTLDLRYELYTSKLTYLYNIQEQCFRCINSDKESDTYTKEDLSIIQDAIEITKEFLRQTIREALNNSLNSAEKKALHATRNSQHS